MHRFQHAAMATMFEIRCAHSDGEYARQAARAAFETVDRLEVQLSCFVENSDIARINHLGAGESAIVSYETMQCLQLAELMRADTAGAFDVSLGTALGGLRLVPDQFLVRAEADGVRIDLGAIGKGYAADRIAEVLEDWDVTRACVAAGYSSVLALEPPPGDDGWPLTLSAPGNGTVLVEIPGRQRALGASGIRKGDHIVDPRTKAPVRSREAVWVSGTREALAAISRQAGIADSPAAVADALSTAFMIAAREECEAYCRRHPGLDAWIHAGELIHYPATMAEPGAGQPPVRSA